MLKMVHEEMDAIVGRDRVVERSDINKLDYLPAIIKETLRLCPVAPPLLVPREAIEDCKLGHAHVPASTRMVVNVWKRHMSTWTPTCRAATSSFCHLDPGGDHVSAPEWPLKSCTSPWSALFMVWLAHTSRGPCWCEPGIFLKPARVNSPWFGGRA